MVSGNVISIYGKPLTLRNLYEEVKIFKIIESRKLRKNVDAPFCLKRFFIWMNMQDNFLA